MNEFLNPKSMATPGAAGGVTMLIANAVSNSFPEIPFRYTCLALSFLLGAIIHMSGDLNMRTRAAFFVVNSLIIFAMGVGTSNIGANVVQAKRSEHASVQPEFNLGSVSSFFVEAAVAQSDTSVKRLESDNQALRSQLDRLHQKNQVLTDQLDSLKSPAGIGNDGGDVFRRQYSTKEGFFNRW